MRTRSSLAAGPGLIVCGFTIVQLSLGGCSKGAQANSPPPVTGCPTESGEVGRLDWSFSETNRTPIREGLIATIELDRTLSLFDEELSEACGGLAKILGVRENELEPEEFHVGTQADRACTVAAEQLGKLKDRSGGRVKITQGTVLCSASMTAAQECFAVCGSGTTPSCGGEMRGTCSGACTGQCTDTEGGSCNGLCEGSCDGSCDSLFDGVCGGSCEGTCNGKPSTERCDGNCQGRCLENARGLCGGVCAGQCEGACTVEAAGQCPGTCAGACDETLAEPHCVGPLSLSESATACDTSCDGVLLQGLACRESHVKVEVEGATNEDAADLLKRSLEQYLPKILAARALNAEPERLNAQLTASASLVETLKHTVDAAGDTLAPQNEACIRDKVEAYQASTLGVPLILSAADFARSLGDSEL